MPADQKKRPARIAADAFDLPVEQRAAFVAKACGTDESVRAEVESLLAADADAGSFLDRPAVRLPESPAAEDTLIGVTIDGFRVIRRIAVGGMGVVYEAEQQNPHRRVALKVIRAGAASASTLRRFEHEAHVLALLQHPGIAQVHEAGAFDTGHGRQPFFAMELIDGRPLTDYAESADLDTRQRLELFVSICDAVHYAHQRGVIHRDLKPGNVLVDNSGQAKVLDFGVARVTDSDLQTTTLHTAVGELIGTVPYMSPEQVLGDADTIDIRSDVYALGVMLYELLSGKLPHDLRDKAIPEAARIIREDEITPLSSVNRIFRGDLETIVSKTLDKDKDRRYASAAELAADVRRYLADEPITARPASAMYQFRKFARRNRAIVIGVAAVFLAVMGGAVVATYGLVQARVGWDDADRQTASLEAVNTFLADLLKAAQPEEAQGREVTVREILDKAAGRITGEFDDQPLVEAQIRTTIGETYNALGSYEEAFEHFETALRLRESYLGIDHLDTMKSMDDLAETWQLRRELEEAEPLYRRVLEVRRRVLGDDHLDTLSSMNNLGLLLSERGKRQEAEQLLRMVLDRNQRLGNEKKALANMHNLALNLSNQGRLAEAEPLYRHILEQRREPHILADFGWHLMDMGKPAEAEPLIREALEEWRRIYPEDHPNIVRLTYYLSRILIPQHKIEEAEELLLALIAGARRQYDETHPVVIRYRYQYGKLLLEAGRIEESEPLFREIMEICIDSFGYEISRTLTAMSTYARTLGRLGRFEEAERIQRRVVDLGPSVLGDETPEELLRWLANHAWLLRELGRQSEAISTLERVVEGRRRVLGDPHPDTCEAMSDLASLYEEQGQDEQAEALREILASQEVAASD